WSLPFSSRCWPWGYSCITTFCFNEVGLSLDCENCSILSGELLMKILILIAIVAAAIIAAAWLLPWWLTLTLLVVIVAPIVWIVWKVVSTIKKEIVPALKKVADSMPRAQERLCSLPAGEAFRGNGFAFAFPVACDVSQMVI